MEERGGRRSCSPSWLVPHPCSASRPSAEPCFLLGPGPPQGLCSILSPTAAQPGLIPSFILREEKAPPVFLCRQCNSGSSGDVVGRSFTSVLFPIQGLCLSWELASGENILRIHPVSSREKKTDQKQQVWQQRGREMRREFLFLLPRSSCLDFDPVPATHQP